jgi:uncharacterized protein YbjQ (UPF0145 family)
MKAKDVAKKYGINNDVFSAWLKGTGYSFKTGAMGGIDIADDQNIDEIVDAFRRQQTDQQEQSAQMAADQRLAQEQKQQALSNLIITPGFNFDGFTITKYSGYISGDHAVEIPRGIDNWWAGGATNVADALMVSLVDIRRQALVELKEAAHALGCNAIIGVDFDYLTLDPVTANSKGETKYLPYVFGVTANGNAVIIEQNKSTGLS